MIFDPVFLRLTLQSLEYHRTCQNLKQAQAEVEKLSPLNRGSIKQHVGDIALDILYNCTHDRKNNSSDAISTDLFLPHPNPREIRKARTISRAVVRNSYHASQLADRLQNELHKLGRWGKESHIYDYHQELNDLILSLVN